MRSIGWAVIRNQFSLEEYFFAPAIEPDHIAIITIEFVPLDHDSLVPNRIAEWKLLADCMANGELWSLSGHAITKEFLPEREDVRTAQDRPL